MGCAEWVCRLDFTKTILKLIHRRSCIHAGYDEDATLTENMKSLLLASLAACATAQLLTPSFGDSFSNLVTSTPRLFVAFCEDSTSLCRTARNTLDYAARALRNNPTVKVAYIDVGLHPEFIAQYGLKRYPRWFLFKQSEVLPDSFNHWRGEADLVQKLLEVAYPAVEEYTNPAYAGSIRERLLKRKLNVVDVVLTADSAPVVLPNLWLLASNYRFANRIGVLARVPSLRSEPFLAPATHHMLDEFPEEDLDYTGTSVRLHVPGDRRPHVWPAGRYMSISNLTDWYDDVMATQVDEADEDVIASLRAAKQPCAILFYDDGDDDEDSAKAKEVFRAVARDFGRGVRFVQANGAIFSRLAETHGHFGVFPAVGAVIPPSSKFQRSLRFSMPGEGSAPRQDKLREYLTRVLDGEERPYLISTKEPYGTKTGDGIWVLNGNTAYRGTYGADTNTLLLVYDPKCGHCQKILPIFKGLWPILHHTPDFRLAMIDASVNEVALDGVKGSEVPTVTLFKRSKQGAGVEAKPDGTGGMVAVQLDANAKTFVAMMEFVQAHLGEQVVSGDADTKLREETDDDYVDAPPTLQDSMRAGEL